MKLHILVIVLVTAAAIPVGAATPTPNSVERTKAALVKNVGLSPAVAASVVDTVVKFQPDIRRHKNEVYAHRDALRELLRTGNDDQTAYASHLAAADNATRKLAASRARKDEAIAKLLTPKERAQFMLIRPTELRLRRGPTTSSKAPPTNK